MTPYEAYSKAVNAGKRLPELEPIVLQDAGCSCHYAQNIIGGRWEEGEQVIATNSYWAYEYAKEIIKGKWGEGEAVIATNRDHAHFYICNVLKWRIKGNKDFYISVIPTLWFIFPKRVKNNPDIMTAYFKEMIV
jgi:hypothetical protein